MEQKQIDTLQQQWLIDHAVGRCLHIGCGMKRIQGAINLDPNPDRYQWSDVAAVGLRLPFCDAVFDSVVSSHVLNFFPDIGAALWEMARVLKPGGRMAHVVPDWRYAPDRMASHWKYEKQAQGWNGPQAFLAAVAPLQELSNVIQFVCVDSFAEFNWSFKVEAVRP